MGKADSPKSVFDCISRRYAIQRGMGHFPMAAFPHAHNMPWVDADTTADKLPPRAATLLSDGELSAISGRPVFNLALDHFPEGLRHAGEKRSPATARQEWLKVQETLQARIPLAIWKEIDKPKLSLWEKKNSYATASAVPLEFKRDEIVLPPPPPLPATHPLAGWDYPCYWPYRKRMHEPADLHVIRLHPKNFSLSSVWYALHSLPASLKLRIPANRDVRLLLQLHELRHTKQPYVTPDKTEKLFQEYDSDLFALNAGSRLGIPLGALHAWLAMRAFTNFAVSLGSKVDYATVLPLLAAIHADVSPARLQDNKLRQQVGEKMRRPHPSDPLNEDELRCYEGFHSWPVERLRAAQRELALQTDLRLVGEDGNITADEIRAFEKRDRKFFRTYDNRHPEVSRQLGRAKLAEDKLRENIPMMPERRLLALKEVWNTRSIKLSPDALLMAGTALEGAGLFWPALKHPDTRLAPAHYLTPHAKRAAKPT